MLFRSGLLERFQNQLGSEAYATASGLLGSSISVAAIGVISYVVVGIISSVCKLESAVFIYIARGALIVFIAAAVIYYCVNRIKAGKNKNEKRSENSL